MKELGGEREGDPGRKGWRKVGLDRKEREQWGGGWGKYL
jgi:hypothetical protein